MDLSLSFLRSLYSLGQSGLLNSSHPIPSHLSYSKFRSLPIFPMNSNFDFDLGLGSNRPRSLNDQKNKSSPSSAFSTAPSQPSKPAWQPNKTSSWTHQPAPAQTTPLNGPTSMVGDIFGKSWASSTATPIAVVNKNPNLFGDLVSSAMGGKINTNTNVPLKNATPANSNNNNNNNSKSAFSMGNVADSLPKTQPGINWGASGNASGFNNSAKINSGGNVNTNKSSGSGGGGGPSLRNMGSGGGNGIGAKKDPFGSLVDLASKPSKSSSSKSSSVVDDAFGDFQNAPKPSTTTNAFPASGGEFSYSNDNSFMGTDSFSGLDGFGVAAAKQSPVQPSTISDPLDMFFPTSSAGSAAASSGVGVQQSSGIDDWGTEFGGGLEDAGGSTTELEGLPPPPAGVSAPAAKSKGMDNYKQGQYPDAIKWLSWAVVLLEKASDRSALSDVLSSRASCYKEVGEYKKAVADCTKVLEQDEANVFVLVQRALLYESMEKYKLGAQDLRTVLKIDPGNRVARGTIHRLTQLAD